MLTCLDWGDDFAHWRVKLLVFSVTWVQHFKPGGKNLWSLSLLWHFSSFLSTQPVSFFPSVKQNFTKLLFFILVQPVSYFHRILLLCSSPCDVEVDLFPVHASWHQNECVFKGLFGNEMKIPLFASPVNAKRPEVTRALTSFYIFCSSWVVTSTAFSPSVLSVPFTHIKNETECVVSVTSYSLKYPFLKCNWNTPSLYFCNVICAWSIQNGKKDKNTGCIVFENTELMSNNVSMLL